MLVLDHVRKNFGVAVPALADISLSVAPGTCTVLLGPSGGGKTTLLRCVAGLEQPDGGSVRWGEEVWDGVDPGRADPGGRPESRPGASPGPTRSVPPEGRSVGMVFQHGALWPQKTAREHLDLVLSVKVRDRAERTRCVGEWLDRVGLTALADRYPDALSGGERQRLALARACAPSPRVLLLDEPLTGLDPASAERLTSLIVDTRRALGCATIWVTHAQEAALPPCDRVAVCIAGWIEQEGPPTVLFSRPRNAAVARLVGFRTFLRAVPLADGGVNTECGRLTLAGPGAGHGRVPTSSLQEYDATMQDHTTRMGPSSADDRSVPAPTMVALRPEQCVASPHGSCLGRVLEVRFLGGRLVCRVQVGTATVEVTSTLDPAPGGEIRFDILGDAVPLDGALGSGE